MFDELKPLADKVLVKRQPKEEKTESGLYLPNLDSEEKNNFGTVICTGPGKYSANGSLIPMGVKIGDLVCFNKYGGFVLDEDYIVLREEDILGVM